jgi:hypothetical protein
MPNKNDDAGLSQAEIDEDGWAKSEMQPPMLRRIRSENCNDPAWELSLVQIVDDLIRRQTSSRGSDLCC